MILRGILIAASGFLFIFSPGLPMSLLGRAGRGAPIDRGLLYWGIGLWLAALIPSLFIQSLLIQIVSPQSSARLTGRPVDYLLTLAGAFVTALFVTLAMAILLRRRKAEAEHRQADGMTLGFGIGLIAQVFNGLILVGAGFRLMFGDTADPALQAAAAVSLLDLLLGLLALVMFRPALLVVSAVQGVLAARAVSGGAGLFWIAVAVGTAFAWIIPALKMIMGATDPGQVLLGDPDRLVSAVTLAYYLLAFWLAYRWLAGQAAHWDRAARSA